MADSPKAMWHARALQSPSLSPQARAYHEQALQSMFAAAGEQAAKTRSKPSAPKQPRAAKKAAAPSPPADAQRAAPKLSLAEEYSARFQHLHIPESNPQPAPKPQQHQPTASYTPDQMQELAKFHERHARDFAKNGDARAAAVHAEKAAALRKTLGEQGQQPGGETSRGNPEVAVHMEKASHSRMLANRAGVARAAAAADVMTAKHKAEEIAADPNRGKGSVEHGMALAEIASHRAKVAHHANVEKMHFADERVHIAHAKSARAENAEESARAENEAQAAHARANQAHEAVRGGKERIAIAKIHAKTAQEKAGADGQEDEGRGHRDPLRERRERIAHAAKNFAELVHTGGDELIKHMQHQVGH